MSFTLEELLERQKTMNASEVPAITGTSPHQTLMDAFILKTMPPVVSEPTEAMESGIYLEDGIRRWVSTKLGVEIIKPEGRRKEGEPFAASPDGEFVQDGKRVGVEIKTTNMFESSEEPQLHHVVQMQMQAYVFDYDLMLNPVLVGGQKLVLHWVERDDDVIARLVEACLAFWELVRTNRPPRIDGSEATRRFIRARYPENNGVMIQASDDAEKYARVFYHAREQEKKWTQLKDHASNKLCYEIEGNDGVLGGLWKATYRLQKGRVEWKNYAISIGGNEKDAESCRGEDFKKFDFRLSKGIDCLPEPDTKALGELHDV